MSTAACATSTIMVLTSLMQDTALLKASAAVSIALLCSAATGIFAALLLTFSAVLTVVSSVLTASPLYIASYTVRKSAGVVRPDGRKLRKNSIQHCLLL
jgi:hypothetical protein